MTAQATAKQVLCSLQRTHYWMVNAYPRGSGWRKRVCTKCGIRQKIKVRVDGTCGEWKTYEKRR